MTLVKQLAQLKADIQTHAALQQSGPETVKIVAVTKHASTRQMLEAFDCGLRDFGENKQQDAEAHMQALAQYLSPEAFSQIHWHFIGHLQSNKVSKIIGKFDLIHSVDSVRLAQKISEAATAQGITQEILLQVNVSGEQSKGGIAPVAMRDALIAVSAMPGLQLCGLMAMAPLSDDPEIPQAVFRELFLLRKTLESMSTADFRGSLPELSMGMTKDYVPALQNGATIIRVGTLLFGENTGQ